MHSKAQIDQILRQKSEAVEIPGVVAVAASGKDVIYQGAFGKRDLSKPDNMTTDSVFWIASMTKAVTTAAAMQLVEQGKLSLEAPIGKLLPDLAAPQVLEGFDTEGGPKLRPAKSPITPRQLMHHTDFVGKAVEAVSGKKLDAYLRDHLFAPLGMNDTGFKLTDAMRQRLVGMHMRGPDGSLAPIPFELEQNPEFHMGGG